MLFIAAITLFSMAKGLRIDDRVKAKATKILGARGATQEFGKQASKVEMRGEIVRKEGAGPATKWESGSRDQSGKVGKWIPMYGLASGTWSSTL